jgi:DNA (cytosine-5)-methyltransferase 1
MLTVGSLFSGIGGFDLGLERAGMRVLWQCESEPFCRAVLARHWPHVPCFDDVRELRATQAASVDVLAGGFPCTDLSRARADRQGLSGAQSGLWSEFARAVREFRPRYVLVENVTELLRSGMGRVLGDLAALGYDAEWDCLPAAAFGAPHIRDRVWIVAYPHQARLQGLHAQTGRVDLQRPADAVRRDWPAEPDLDRVADGVSARLEPAGQRNDRIRAIGNACLPQIAEWIGRRIVSYEEAQHAA